MDWSTGTFQQKGKAVPVFGGTHEKLSQFCLFVNKQKILYFLVLTYQMEQELGTTKMLISRTGVENGMER